MKLANRLNTQEFRLAVKQRALVLEFTTAVEEAMEARGLNQQALATILHKTRAWISKLLRKQSNLTFFTAVKVADALDLDIRIEFKKSVQ